MTEVEIASLAGIFVTLVSVVIFLTSLITNDYKPIERRAIRMAILAGVTSVVAVIAAVVAIYYFVSPVISAFLWFPSIGLATIAAWHASRLMHRLMGGGGQEPKDHPSQGTEASS